MTYHAVACSGTGKRCAQFGEAVPRVHSKLGLNHHLLVDWRPYEAGLQVSSAHCSVPLRFSPLLDYACALPA